MKTKELTHLGILEFIEGSDFKMEAIRELLVEKHKNCIYMLFDMKNKRFLYERFPLERLDFEAYRKDKEGFILETNLGLETKVLLRWKGCMGIGWAALQISFLRKKDDVLNKIYR